VVEVEALVVVFVVVQMGAVTMQQKRDYAPLGNHVTMCQMNVIQHVVEGVITIVVASLLPAQTQQLAKEKSVDQLLNAAPLVEKRE
jgi:hypothetical protein